MKPREFDGRSEQYNGWYFMQQHPDSAFRPLLSKIEEDRILTLLETIVSEYSPNSRQGVDVTAKAAGTRGRRRLPIFFLSALILIIALLPAGLKRADGLGRSAHQASTE